MSNDTQKADQIAFHFYTKLFYVINQARATSEPRTQPKVDKWFNLETPDSDLFAREAREPYRNISVVTPPPLEIQVVLAIPELANNQVLVYLTPESSRARIEPTPRSIVLESWTLSFVPRRGTEDDSIDVALPTIYKHGIPLFRSLYSLLRVLPAWKLYKRLKRRTHHLSIHLHVRSSHDPDHVTLNFDTPASPSLLTPLATQTHTFSPVPHPLGTLTLSARYLEDPNFQLEALESVLSSRFISQDLGGSTGFTPTLTKNQQRDSSIISSMSRSPPRRIVSSDESATIAERFILPVPTRTPSIGTTPVRNIPQQPPRQLASGEFAGIPTQSPSGLTISRLRKESQGSSSSPSSSFSGGTIPFVVTNPALSSLSSSPSSGTGPIRRPSINPVHPFKSNTVSVPASSSPSLSIRQTGSPHSRSASLSGGRHPPSPIGVGFNRPSPPNPSVEGGRRPGTSGSAGSGGTVGDHERRAGESSDDPAKAGIPPRKRYSSSFGHRYAGSVGSAGGGSAEGGGGGSVSGRSTPAIPPSVSGLGIEVPRERKESTSAGMASFRSTATDDDDISIFVQDIDSRKPLSGRAKEREKREWERQQDALRETHRQQEGRAASGGQGHDREDSDASTVKPGSGYSRRGGLSTSPPPSAPSSRFSTSTRTGGTPTSGPSATSSGFSPSRDRSVVVAQAQASASTSTSPPALSLSPIRGPMLTSQVEVEERLRRMNETFLKSLEGFGAGSNAAKRKERELRKKEKEREKERSGSAVVSSGKSSSETTGSGGEGGANGGGGGGGGDARPGSRADGDGDAEEGRRPTSRAVSIRSPREHALVDRGWGASGANTTAATNTFYAAGANAATMGFTSLGMGLRRAAEEEQGESIGSLGQSEVNASQGSEEVIGKMELYERRSRSRGY